MKLNLSSFLQWRINIFICLMLGWKITFFYIRFLGKLYFFFNRKEKWKIKKAVKSVFSRRKYNSDIESITRNVFRGIVFHYYEKFFNVFSTHNTTRAFVKTQMEGQGLDTIKQGLSRGHGVLLVTGHFGGVELIPSFFAVNNYPVTIVARFSSNHLRQISLQKANHFSVKIIDADKTRNVLRSIFNDLRDNRIVITQCDEIDEWKPCRKDKIFFLGKRIYLDKTFNVLSKKCASAIVFGVMHRDCRQRYKFVATSWEEIAKKYQRSVDMSVGAVLLKFMEQYIYKNPEEWYQWKKYPTLNTFSPSEAHGQESLSTSLLKPHFEKL